MKISCGTDIIEIQRIQESIENLGDKFIQRIYTEEEIAYCNSKNIVKYQHFAARFAAKEAAFKALSEQIPNKYEINWTDIEIKNNEQGKPYLVLKNINRESIESIDISISHCKEYAVANVVILYK